MLSQAFFKTSDFGFFEPLQAHVAGILAEGREVAGRQESLSFFFPDMFNRDGLLAHGSRARYMLRLAGLRLALNERFCPRTAAALEGIPGLVSAGFYLLGPHSHIRPHHGAGEQFLRVHLGVVVPPNCAIKVAGEERAWREGEFLIFDDAFEHEAWNRSDQLRCVFHFDFFHGVEPAEQPSRLASLERRVVEASPVQHVPWLLAGVESSAENLRRMEQTRALAHPGRLAELDQQIQAHGLFMT